MKKSILLAFFFALLFNSCSKDASTNSAQINFDYSGHTTGNYASTPSSSSLTKVNSLFYIKGQSTVGSTINSSLFIMYADIAVGTHYFKTLPNGSPMNFSYSTGNTAYLYCRSRG